MNEIKLPVEVLGITAMASKPGEFFRVQTDAVHVGRDEEGCFAVATDTKGLCLARWEPDENDAPAGTQFLVSVACFNGAKVAAKAILDFGVQRIAVFAAEGSILRVRSEREGGDSCEIKDASDFIRFPDWRSILDPKRSDAWDEIDKHPLCPVMLKNVAALFNGAGIGEWLLTPKLMKHGASVQWVFSASKADDDGNGLRFTVIAMPLVAS